MRVQYTVVINELVNSQGQTVSYPGGQFVVAGTSAADAQSKVKAKVQADVTAAQNSEALLQQVLDSF